MQEKIANLMQRFRGSRADPRKVILHYHLFKNAGTSLDASFIEYFEADEWVTTEFPSEPQENQQQLRDWIAQSSSAKCFSSHTATLPPPAIAGVSIFPVIFVRHPIDRVASVYEFERKQGSDTYGSVLARNSDLSEYVEARLARLHDYQCRNFHVHRFAAMYPDDQGSVVERANRAVANLPFVGVVSRFEQSLRELEHALRDFGFADIVLQSAQKNVSRNINQTMDEKLEEIRSKMSQSVYQSLVEANSEDLAFYDSIANRH